MERYYSQGGPAEATVGTSNRERWLPPIWPDEVVETLEARTRSQVRGLRLWLLLTLIVALPLAAVGCGSGSGKQSPTAAAATTTASAASATPTSATPSAAASPATTVVSPPSTPAGTPLVQSTPAATATPTPTPRATPVARVPTPTPTLPPHGQTALVPILMYHYVRPSPGPSDPIGVDLSVPPQNFEEQIAWLVASGFNTMTMRELEEVRAGKIGLPPKPIVLTFDDGYRDFYTSVFPLLKKYHLKATAFIITGFVGQPAYMTWGMIEQIDKSGLVDVGAHTVTHLDLAQLSTAEQTEQIDNCQKALEQHLGHTVYDFAYPSGDYNSTTLRILQQAGFQTAVTTQNRWSQATDPPLQLPRVRVHGQVTLFEYKAMLQ